MLGFGSSLPNLVSLLPSGTEGLASEVLRANNLICQCREARMLGLQCQKIKDNPYKQLALRVYGGQ